MPRRPTRKDRQILAAIPSHVPVHPYPHHRECRTARCARNADALFNAAEARKRRRRERAERRRAEREGTPALASWYDDAGGTACGTHFTIGVAHKTLPCGTEVRLCFVGRCEVAIVEDRGPFIAGREFDLNPGAKAGIGCSDLCPVKYTVLRK